MLYDALGHVIHGKIKTTLLRKRVYEGVGKNLEADEAAEALGERWLDTDVFFATIALFSQTKTMDAIPYSCKIDVFRTTSLVACANKGAVVVAEAQLVHYPFANASSESSNEEGYKGYESCGRTTLLRAAPVETEAASRASRTQHCE